MAFTFKCKTCDELHTGMPTFGADAPLIYYALPEDERERRCSLGSDDCVLDEKHFFIRGCIEIPVIGEPEPFVWGVWVSLSPENFKTWLSVFGKEHRSHLGPFFGWLSSYLPPYPNTENLKTMVHLRDSGTRPSIELEPTDHPLAIEQREGITVERLGEIYSLMNKPISS